MTSVVILCTHFIRTIHSPSLHSREYLIGLAPEFVDVLVSAEAHGDLKVREDCLHDVLDAISSSESETVYVRPSDWKNNEGTITISDNSKYTQHDLELE